VGHDRADAPQHSAAQRRLARCIRRRSNCALCVRPAWSGDAPGACPRRDRTRIATFPPGLFPRAKFFLGCGTNASSAKTLVLTSAAVFMPVVPDVNFCYVMPAGACKTLTRPNARASRARVPCAIASLPVSARACVMCRRRQKRACAEVRGSAAWVGGCPALLDARRVGRLATRPRGGARQRQAAPRGLRCPSRIRRCPSQPRGDHRRAECGDAARLGGCGLSRPARHPAGR
jgi:hypothetical protein